MSILFSIPLLSIVFAVRYPVNFLRFCGFRDLPVHRYHPSVDFDFPFFDLRNYLNIFPFSFPLSGKLLCWNYIEPRGFVFLGGFLILVFHRFALLAQFRFADLLWRFRYIGVSLCVYNIAQVFSFCKSECSTKENICLCA